MLGIHISCSNTNVPRLSVLICPRSNNMIFTTCIETLLGTLKLWDPARHGTEGLALMLSASSPSDTEHRFNRCEIKNGYPFHYAEDLDLTPGMADFHRMNIADPFSRHFHRDCPPPVYGEHLNRVQGTPLRFKPRRGEGGRFISQYKCLPAVPIVKGLVMRRQFRREIHVKTLSWLLGRSFVALEWFRFERTVSLGPHKQISFDQGMKRGPATKFIRRVCDVMKLTNSPFLRLPVALTALPTEKFTPALLHTMGSPQN